METEKYIEAKERLHQRMVTLKLCECGMPATIVLGKYCETEKPLRNKKVCTECYKKEGFSRPYSLEASST